MVWWFDWFRPRRQSEKIEGIKYKVMIEPHLDKEFFKECLKMVPNYFNFEIVEWDESKLYQYLDGEWKGFYIPRYDYNICIFDGIKHGVKYAGGTIFTRCGVAYFGESKLDIAVRILHELMHSLEQDADGMCRNKDFSEWLPTYHKVYKAEVCARTRGHDLIYHLAYLYFLLSRVKR